MTVMLCCVEEEGRREEGRERREGGRNKEGGEEEEGEKGSGEESFFLKTHWGQASVVACSVGQAGRAGCSPSPHVRLSHTMQDNEKAETNLSQAPASDSESQNTKPFVAALLQSPHDRPQVFMVLSLASRHASLSCARPVDGGEHSHSRHLADGTWRAVGRGSGWTRSCLSLSEMLATSLVPELRGLIRWDTVGERQGQWWLLILSRTFLCG